MWNKRLRMQDVRGLLGAGAGILFLTACLAVSSCAGLAQVVQQPGPPACGPDYATPNYARDNDPGTGAGNQLLRWRNFPLRVAFSREVVFDPGGLSISSSDMIKEAVARWGAETGGQVQFVYPADGSNPDVVVDVPTLGSEPGPGQFLGKTEITYEVNTGIIRSARITINTWSGMTVDQFVGGLKSTASHEFGHALFLNGHSADPADLMYFRGDQNSDSFPTTRDRNTIVTAYCGDFSLRPQGAAGPLQTKTIACGRGFNAASRDSSPARPLAPKS